MTALGRWSGQGEDETVKWFADQSGRPVIRFDAGNKRGTELNVMVRQGTGGGVKGDWRKAQTIRVDPRTAHQQLARLQSRLAGPDADAVLCRGARGRRGHDRRLSLRHRKGGDGRDDVLEGQCRRQHRDHRSGNRAYAGAIYWEDRLKFEYVDPGDEHADGGAGRKLQHGLEPRARLALTLGGEQALAGARRPTPPTSAAITSTTSTRSRRRRSASSIRRCRRSSPGRCCRSAMRRATA